MSAGSHFSTPVTLTLGEAGTQTGWVVGYAAIIAKWQLPVPQPMKRTLVSERNRRLDTTAWRVLPNRYLPEDRSDMPMMQALYHHLVFALKYEGVDLLVFSKMWGCLQSEELLELVQIEPLGKYARRIWFLVEWTTGRRIEGKRDLEKKSYVPAVDEKLQYAVDGVKSSRHRVLNNLPGTSWFCPLIFRTPTLEQHIQTDYIGQNRRRMAAMQRDLAQRAASFLLLKDSKASFTIEGESPDSRRADRWGVAIGEAGQNDLSADELVRLQRIVMQDTRFATTGFRQQGGFVGEHDRHTGQPIPEHISARPEDLPDLVDGLIDASRILTAQVFHPVLAASVVSFGFVFIHPFADGNGRLHRYLIHHMLAKKGFSEPGAVFPVSAAILDRIDAYREVLQSHSRPLLPFIEWQETADHNIRVMNDTRDYYRFFDATAQAEFLFDCVRDTLEDIVPREIEYLSRYDRFRRSIQSEFDMPDKKVSVLVRFLEQNEGVLSKRARQQEFKMLELEEVEKIEHAFATIFQDGENPGPA
jgi:Fic family protein